MMYDDEDVVGCCAGAVASVVGYVCCPGVNKSAELSTGEFASEYMSGRAFSGAFTAAVSVMDEADVTRVCCGTDAVWL